MILDYAMTRAAWSSLSCTHVRLYAVDPQFGSGTLRKHTKSLLSRFSKAAVPVSPCHSPTYLLQGRRIGLCISL